MRGAEPQLFPVAQQDAFRDILTRRWSSLPLVVFGMQNPSTADERRDDPTTHRITNFARRWGYGGWAVVNLRRWRSPDPAQMYRWWDAMTPAGQEEHARRSMEIMVDIASGGDLFVAAWGNGRPGDTLPARALAELRRAGITPHHLGITMSGAPKHPLARGLHRIPDDRLPTRWDE